MVLVDVEQLILEVKSHPCLWDYTDVMYRNTQARKAARLEICRVFDENFDNKSATERQNFEKLLLAKWRHVRDNYIKSVKQQMQGMRKNYIFAKHLSFLSGILGFEGASEGDSNGINEELRPRKKIRRIFPKICAIEPQQSQPPQSQPSQSQPPQSQPPQSQPLQPLVENPVLLVPTFSQNKIDRCPPPKERTSTQLFMDSVIPLVEQFSEDNQILFRCEVMNLIRTIRAKEKADSSETNVTDEDQL